MNKLVLICLTIFSLGCKAQTTEKYNLGFEQHKDDKALSDGWFKWGDYVLTIDSLVHSGAKSGKITSDSSGNSFGSIAYSIPANYKGKTIKLEGFMKITNVENGFAGLMLRIDGAAGTLAFDNMQSQQITGTRDWQEYNITLPYPEGAKNILIAGILAGKGEAWFDDFTVSIDGKDVQTLAEEKIILPKAQTDSVFDKGSGIALESLSNEQITNLELLGRVWGFLKYYHPQIAQGNYNWDYELFRFLPKYVNVKTAQDREQLLVDWISSLGDVAVCQSCQPTHKDAKLKPDLAWVDKQSASLKDKLLYIYSNRSQGDHYYLDMVAGVGNPVFKNENAYSKMSYPDAGFRLLSLYRYWNMIQYFFPYKKLMDEDWNKKLAEYIPVFVQAKDELSYELVALQIIGDIQDTHANLWSGGDKIEAWKGTNYAPIRVGFVEDQLVVTDYYKDDLKSDLGIKIGDVITEINGQSIEAIIKEKSKYYPASNKPTRLRNLSADLLRSTIDQMTIEYRTDRNDNGTKTIQLYPRDSLSMYGSYKPSKEKSYKMLEDNIGYVTLQTIQDADVPQIKREFENTKGIIIDIRNYPSAFVPFSLGSYFVALKTPFVRFTAGNINNPGEFTVSQSAFIDRQGQTYTGKLIVLVNELTQSQAEYTAMAFRAGKNTTIIGSTTAGADGNVSIIDLPGGLRTMISGIGVYYPDGTETQRVGIVPDIEVKPTINGIKAGRDELLEKAIELIKN
ncbi:S41 family peptidase [Sphingobacterium corticibacter]|uniref:Peptidase S41 n=1 Tax=Sphingobacterium corticibacter TaxID=2171749 RepID=A0A2T8HEX0_9SPHI|nr:S41 family peptidase [Sphingobacterium corticibacter]PVH23953.1 peptidase S41 [Sphingobacterium corticibacter]